MAVKWNCDICGKDTYVNPPTKPILKEDGTPEVAKVKIQNQHTGKIEEYQVPKVQDLAERTFIIKLSAGQEKIQKDLCKNCVKTVQNEVQALWNKLSSLESK